MDVTRQHSKEEQPVAPSGIAIQHSDGKLNAKAELMMEDEQDLGCGGTSIMEEVST
jgi:hypothetical protein